MIFRQLFDHKSSTYTYLLADEETRKAVIIDPVIDAVDNYLMLLAQLNLTLKFALDTHTHADHITALGKLRELTGCTTLIGAEANSDCVSTSLHNGDKIQCGALTIIALHTPGHTDDSYSFVVENQNKTYLFSGDTLLIRGTGRTDFQNGSAEAQYQSLFNKLLTLPEDTLVYPAHDYKGWMVSSIGEEKAHNPRLQVGNMAEYVAIMNNLNLPNPAMMDVAVPANRACGNLT